MSDARPVALDAHAVAARDYDLDALRLLRLVRLRRELRLLWRLAALAVPVWALISLSAEAALPRTSSTFWAVDDATGPVFLGILTVLVVAFVVQVSLGLLGRTGRVAAALVPTFARGGEPVVRHGAQVPGLIAALRRKSLVGAGAVTIFVAVAGCAIAAGWNVPKAWRGNHGSGGTVVTVGRDATIDGYRTSSHGVRTYYLDTPVGRALAQDHEPRAGERWTVFDPEVGNAQAYLVGGHDYLLVAGIALALLAFDVGVVFYALGGVRRERALRAAAGHAPLAASLDALGAGRRSTVVVGARAPVVLGLRPLGRRTGAQVLRRGRIVAWTSAGVVAAAALTGTVLWRAGTFRTPPLDRRTDLPYLAGAGWRPSVFADYRRYAGDDGTLQDAARYARLAPPRVTDSWAVLLDHARLRDGYGSALVGYADVRQVSGAGTGRLPAAIAADQRWLADYDHVPVTTVAGLPAGWVGIGIAAQGADHARVEVAGAEGDHLVVLQIRLDATGATEAQAIDAVIPLAAAIARRGIGRFAADTARP